MNMSKIPKILHMIWIGAKQPPQYFLDNLNKWKSLMPNWSYMVWTNDKLTKEYFDDSFLNLIKQARNGAQAADLLGYYVIEKWGGYFMDADITPFKSLDELDTQKSNVILCHDVPIAGAYIATGFFGSVQNHILFQNLVKECYNIDFSNEQQQVTAGPGLMGQELFKFDWENSDEYLMLPYWYFYRNRVGDPGPYVPNRITRDQPDAFGNHFYAAEWLTPKHKISTKHKISPKHDIAIGIRGCIYDPWLHSWNECLDTWAGKMINDGWRVRVHIGHPELDCNYKEINNFLVCNTTERNDGVFMKSIYHPSKWLIEQNKYTHIFVTDSDTFIHPKRFEETIIRLNEKYEELDYVGGLRLDPMPADLKYELKTEERINLSKGFPEFPHSIVYASGGSGFLISKKAAKAVIEIVDSKDYLNHPDYNDTYTHYDDLCLGLIMKIANIPLIYSNSFQSTSPKINDINDYDPPGIETKEGHHIAVQHYRKNDMKFLIDSFEL
jgi:hypothetical protein